MTEVVEPEGDRNTVLAPQRTPTAPQVRRVHRPAERVAEDEIRIVNGESALDFAGAMSLDHAHDRLGQVIAAPATVRLRLAQCARELIQAPPHNEVCRAYVAPS